MIRPLSNRVVIEMEPVETEETSVGGIILPNQDRATNYRYGKVISVGPGYYEKGKLIPVSLEVGQRVYFHFNSGVRVQDEGKEFILIRENDVVCIIEE